MKRQGLLTDRMPLIEALERETGQKAVYCGAPSFKYTVGSNTVYRDGSLKSDDTELIRKLEEDGLIEGITEAESISYPLDDFTGRSLVNLVNSMDRTNFDISGKLRALAILITIFSEVPKIRIRFG